MEIAEICVLTAGLGVSSVIDLLVRKVSVKILALLFVAGCIFRVMQGDMFEIAFLWRILPGVICILLTKITHGGIGLGDGYMLLVLGMFFNIEELISVCIIASCLAGLVAMGLLFFGHKKKNYEIPFVPFLSLGCAIVKMVYGG